MHAPVPRKTNPTLSWCVRDRLLGGVGHWWLLQLLVPAHYVMITSLVYFAIYLIVLVS
jgi:hypothetical protein